MPPRKNKRGQYVQGRSDRRWYALTKKLKATLDPVCWICGKPIDLALHHTDRWSWTADHLQPLDTGVDPYDEANILPAHRSCNSSRGARYGNERRAATTGLEPLPADARTPRFTRRW